MTWLKGTIEEFKGGSGQHADRRKIRTRPEQRWDELYYFTLPFARAAGYSDDELAHGMTIEFEPDPRAAQPRVLRFKPREGRPDVHPATPSVPRPASTPAPTFLNPYHFIPLQAPAPESLEDADEILERGTLHDRFGSAPGGAPRYSGRVVCRLETEGPLVIGAEQSKADDESEREVHPFGLPDPEAPEDPYRRAPMIPGSALRGLISSLVEAASCSTMRVLGDRTFTRRAELGPESLSAMGQVVEEGGVLKLRPLTLSVQEMTHQGEKATRERCRVLLNAYRFDHGAKRTVYSTGTFLDLARPVSGSSSRQEYWYLKLQAADWHWKPRGDSQFLLGLISDEGPIPQSDWEALDPSQQALYTRGLLFVLGIEEPGKAGNLPPDKKHEYFLPFPDDAKKMPLLEIPEAVLERFRSLARASEEIDRGGGGGEYPFLPAGREREKGGVEVRAGDLVYYGQDDEKRLNHLSFSSTWRRPVEGSLYGVLEQRVSPHLVPLSAQRQQLTLAERLFGFVEDQGKRALAGRLRFAHALVESERPEDGWYAPPVTLKILAAPKPPSAALYFGNMGYQGRRQLDLRKHTPQGRKVYLHHPKKDVEAGCYASSDPGDKRKLKARVRTLRAETRFLFHVDFENLSAEELGHLLYALRPTKEFRHKLGMGKPLGLGTVRIDPLALAWRDREGGYAPDALFAGKYRWIETPVDPGEWGRLPPPLAERYRHEAEASGAGDAAPAPGLPRIEALREAVRKRIPERVRYALELLGNPSEVNHPVTYPLLLDQREGEHFQWFVRNDKERELQKAMGPIVPGKELPHLERYGPRPPRPRR